jgi:hypothetical protein
MKSERHTNVSESSVEPLLNGTNVMTDSEKFGEADRRRLEILALLDARYRLREDPSRRSELDDTRSRLQDELINLRQLDQEPD